MMERSTQIIMLLEQVFINLRKRFPSASIGIPYKIGCGLGGGDWNIVEDIIKTVFRDKKSDSVTIYKLEE